MIAQTAIIAMAMMATVAVLSAHAQDDDTIAFHEVAQVVINAADTGNTTVSVTLQSTSTEDILIPEELASRIAADGRLAYIALTNEGSCVLGVIDESCILVSVLRSGEWNDIDAVQAGAREIGDSYIDELNDLFDTRATFHSVYIRHSEDARRAQAADQRIVSAVYTMPKEHTASMHTKVGGIILSRDIREGGGFYEASRRIVALEGSQMLVSITSVAGSPFMQVRVSAMIEGADAGAVDPLALFPFDSLERSDVFAPGSNPLGSLVHAIVVPPEPSRVSMSSTALLPTVIIDGELLPSAVGRAGWVFDPISGPVIDGRFLFGSLVEVEDDALAFSTVLLDAPPADTETPSPPDNGSEPARASDTTLMWYALGAGAIAAAAVALYALRRR